MFHMTQTNTSSVGADPRRWWILAALCSVLLLVGLDLTILNVAVPVIGADLDASVGELQWIVNGYTVVLAALLLPVGQLGDRFGRKRLLLAGLVVFGIASLLCAFAPTPGFLILGRALLGLGAAFLNTLGLAVLVSVFPAEERPRAIGIQAAAVSAGMPLGPIVGGFLLENFWWGSVFLLNLPLVLIVFIALAVLVRESRSERPVRVDVTGGILAVGAVAILSYGLITAGETSWTNGIAIAGILAGLVLLVVFVIAQRRVKDPMADLSLFKESGYTWGSILSTAVQFVVFGVMFIVPQYSYVVLDASPVQVGLHLLPLIAAMILAIGVASRVRKTVGARAIMAAGFVALAAGLTLGALSDAESGFGLFALWTGLIGVGFGAAMPPALDIALAPVPSNRSGVGSALLQAQRQVGAVLGVAIMGSVLALNYRARLDTAAVPAETLETVEHSAPSGQSVAEELGSTELAANISDAFTHGMAASFWVAAGVSVACALVSVIFIRKGADQVTDPEHASETR
ncbi:DHA2 family efflux MFS transporter permease subunit [Arthrobacter tecti]